jgi:hypothetical protein
MNATSYTHIRILHIINNIRAILHQVKINWHQVINLGERLLFNASQTIFQLHYGNKFEHKNKILKCVAMVNKKSLMKKEMTYKLDVYSG